MELQRWWVVCIKFFVSMLMESVVFTKIATMDEPYLPPRPHVAPCRKIVMVGGNEVKTKRYYMDATQWMYETRQMNDAEIRLCRRKIVKSLDANDILCEQFDHSKMFAGRPRELVYIVEDRFVDAMTRVLPRRVNPPMHGKDFFFHEEYDRIFNQDDRACWEDIMMKNVRRMREQRRKKALREEWKQFLIQRRTEWKSLSTWLRDHREMSRTQAKRKAKEYYESVKETCGDWIIRRRGHVGSTKCIQYRVDREAELDALISCTTPDVHMDCQDQCGP
jgi:hypothetical protein